MLVCELLSNLVQREFGFDVLARAADGQAALKACLEQDVDLLIADLLLPKMDGIELSRRLLEVKPQVRILAISSECDDYTTQQVYSSGILGFVDKNEMNVETLREALDHVAEGRSFYSSSAQRIIRKMKASPEAYYKIFTDREMQVVRLIAEGKNHEAAAKILGISALTIRRHKHNAMRKIDVHNEVELLRYAMQRGIVKSKSGLDWTNAGRA